MELDKAAINTAAIKNPKILFEASRIFGAVHSIICRKCKDGQMEIGKH